MIEYTISPGMTRSDELDGPIVHRRGGLASHPSAPCPLYYITACQKPFNGSFTYTKSQMVTCSGAWEQSMNLTDFMFGFSVVTCIYLMVIHGLRPMYTYLQFPYPNDKPLFTGGLFVLFTHGVMALTLTSLRWHWPW